MSDSAWFGLLNINKPRGKTSRWAVDQIKRLVRPDKVGHAGTLDPLATGVLVVCIGAATRLVDYVQQLPKRYRAEFLLGCTSPTEDVDGELYELTGPPIPARAEIEQAAAKFVGEILQRPPVFSALKVSGRRAYELARKGRTVELQPRKVTIHRLELVDYAYPRLALDIECSSGTYVRSLGRDLAESLGTGAVMSALVRIAIGNFRLEESVHPEMLTGDHLPRHLISPLRAVEHLPQIELDRQQSERIARGQFIASPKLESATGHSQEFAAVDDCGNLVAIIRRRPDGQLGPVHNFRSA